MNPIQKFFARLALKKIRDFLNSIDRQQLLDIAVKINKKVDIPKLSEATEYNVISNTLITSVDVAKELLDLVKV